MAYDEKLAARVRRSLEQVPGVEERKMFGGLAFLLHGHMFCGIVGSDLMVRVGPEDYETTLAEAHVRPMDFTGRPLRGMVYVGAAGLRSAPALRKWVQRGQRLAHALPPKASAKPRRQRGRSKRPASHSKPR